MVRVLNNLRLSAQRSGDRAGTVRALELQAALPGAGVEERRQLAAAVAATGRFDRGAVLYEALGHEDPAHAEEHRRTAARLRASMN